MKVFGQAFQMTPLSGVHLASAGMHHGGCASFYQGALNVGQALAIMGKFDAEAALAMIERHGVTTAYMVPTQFVRLLRLPTETRERYDVSSLRSAEHTSELQSLMRLSYDVFCLKKKNEQTKITT